MPVIVTQHSVGVCMVYGELMRIFEKNLGQHSKEFCRVGGAVAVDETMMAASAVFDQSLVFRPQHVKPAL